MSAWDKAKRDRELHVLSRRRTSSIKAVSQFRTVLGNPRVALKVKLYMVRAYPGLYPGKPRP